MPTPPPSAAERFASILRWLSGAVAARGGGDRLSFALIGLIIDRIREINQRVARLVARIREGRYAPRRSGPRRPPDVRRPRPPNRLPRKFGWLLQLVPEAVGYRSQLEHLLPDAEMAALLAAAPASLGRPLRSLCWMLRLRPPAVVAAPARPRPPRKTPATAPEPPPPEPPRPQPPRPQPPAWFQDRRRPWSLARIRGSPRSA